MAFRHPQVDIAGNDLLVRIPLENIPNMPQDPKMRAVVLQHLRASIAGYMNKLDAAGLHPATPGVSKAIGMPAMAPRAGVLSNVG